jgi:hypothetical protein
MRRLLVTLALLLATVAPSAAQQFSRPTTDAVVGVWTTSPGGSLASNIDETVAADADLILSTNANADETCRVNLSTLTNPGATTGHVVRVRGRKAAGAGGWLDVKLYSAGVLVATKTTNGSITSSFQTFAFTLTGPEAAAISNYASLQLEIIKVSNGFAPTIEVSWAELQVPLFGRRVFTTVQAALPPEGLLILAIAAALQRRRTPWPR